jgi:OmpA-OmpF porin, OOP family
MGKPKLGFARAQKMNIHKRVQQVALLAASLAAGAAGAENYIGTLKVPSSPAATPLGFYSLSEMPPPQAAPRLGTDNGYRLKLGYKYSRYLSVESEYVDFGSTAGSIFANPANLSTGFRSTGISIDTIATLPLWRQFSFYGRLGAYSGPRNLFGASSISLVGDSNRSRVRYGLGMRYDFTKAFGIRAELERNSLLASPFGGESDADLFSVGVSWRF